MDDEVGMSPVLAPKQKDAPKEEPIDNSPSKTLAGSVKGTPSAPKSAKAKRKSGGDDTKSFNGTSAKKAKTENSDVDDCSAPADTTSISTLNGEDELDKTILHKIMQVNHFGHGRRTTEDSTTTSLEIERLLELAWQRVKDTATNYFTLSPQRKRQTLRDPAIGLLGFKQTCWMWMELWVFNKVFWAFNGVLWLGKNYAVINI